MASRDERKESQKEIYTGKLTSLEENPLMIFQIREMKD